MSIHRSTISTPAHLRTQCDLRYTQPSHSTIDEPSSMHDTPDQPDRSHWHEPKAGENAGLGKFLHRPMPYDTFMEAEGVPIYRGIGARRVQDLPMQPWQRLGGRGSYIQL